VQEAYTPPASFDYGAERPTCARRGPMVSFSPGVRINFKKFVGRSSKDMTPGPGFGR
jgi:hypothetical protein